MNRELLEFYNRELNLLYETAKDFAEEYPSIAERLGGLTRERGDPMVIGLLEGVALLAARVQLKIKHEFPEFTYNLIEQLLPNYLAPMPSVMLAKITPTYGDPALRAGVLIAKGATLDAVYREKDRNVSCTFVTGTEIQYWPFEITRAEYIPALGPLQALRLDCPPDVAAGLRLTLTLRTTARADDEGDADQISTDPNAQISGCALSVLPVHLVGAEAEAVSLYEQIFARCTGVLLRHLDGFGDPQVIRLGPDCLEQVGFDEDDSLLPHDSRMFQGFTYLQEFFVFPRKFLGFRIKGLDKVLHRIKTRAVDIVLTFDQSVPHLAASINPGMFALYCGTAVNLFKKNMDRIQLKANSHEYQVVPDRAQYLNFEPQRVLDVFLHYPGRAEKVSVPPLYAADLDSSGSVSSLAYTTRRLERKRSSDERRFGSKSDYVGTDMFISVTPPSPDDLALGTLELSLTALCSNRHLAEHLPVGRGGSDFRLRQDLSLDVTAIIPPTKPREAPIMLKHEPTAHLGMGPVAWRLINLLSLNHVGLTAQDGRALREILSMFADLGDAAVDRRIRGIRAIETRAVVRRLQQKGGTGAARGIEISVTFDSKAFEGSGVFLLGAILDRFFAEYVAINHFTQTVIKTVERGTVMRWPPRSGSRSVF